MVLMLMSTQVQAQRVGWTVGEQLFSESPEQVCREGMLLAAWHSRAGNIVPTIDFVEISPGARDGALTCRVKATTTPNNHFPPMLCIGTQYEGDSASVSCITGVGRVCEPINRDAAAAWYAPLGINAYTYPYLDPGYREETNSCHCPAGHTWAGSFCALQSVQIGLHGPSSTRTLPVGPALTQVVRLNQGGTPLAGKSVTVSVNGGVPTNGVTDANGEFKFTYVPPHVPAVDQVVASCTDCAVPARKSIKVESCWLCEGMAGNPIQPATGEKIQLETDWADSATHPLGFARHYRSYGPAVGSLGPGWAHTWDVSLSKSELEATVRFGSGQIAVFRRPSLALAWQPEGRADLLSETGSGTIYRRASDDSEWFFGETGKLLQVKERNGWTTTLTYSAEGRLASVSNAFGRVLRLVYEGERLTAFTSPDGRVVSFTYDGAGRLYSAHYPDGLVRTYHYEDSRHQLALTGISDESGARFATFSYDERGRAVSTEHAAGTARFEVNYSQSAPEGRVVPSGAFDPSVLLSHAQVTEPTGSARSYVWGSSGGAGVLVGASAPSNGATVASRTMSSAGLPEVETDFMGVQTMYTWDINRQLKTSTTQAAGLPETRTKQTQWHPTFGLPVLVQESGRTTAYAYDALGNKLSEVVTDTQTGQQRTKGWTYDAKGLVETFTDERGGVWQFGYDPSGNRTSVRAPDGRVTTYTYDTGGRVLSQASPGRPTHSFTWDVRGRLISQSAGGEVTSYTYLPTGQLASITEPSGYRADYAYDAAQRLVGMTDNRGASISYTLDAAGNRVREEVKDAGGNLALVTARVISSQNRVVAIQGSAGQRTQLGYDANGELVSETDPVNQTTRTSLDGLRRPTVTTFADRSSVQQTWNALDAVTQVTDPKGVKTTYTTNAFGEVMQEHSPDIGTIKYTRDASGQVISIEDAKGQITQISRDALGRPTEIRYAADHMALFEYNAAGDVVRMEDKSGVTAYERDGQGRITGKTQDVNDTPASPSRFRVGYGYASGQLTAVTYPSGLKITYKRVNGRIVAIDAQEPGGTVRRPKPIVPLVSNLTHTALGVPKAWNWFTGDSAARTFDADGRMTANEFASYTFDTAGRINEITQQLWAQRTTETGATEWYQAPLTWYVDYLDRRNRLTHFFRLGAETSYTYDANGNRIAAQDKLISDIDLDGEFEYDDFTQTTSRTLNVEGSSSRLLGFTQTITKAQRDRPTRTVSTTVNYTVDANGSITSDGLRDFEYGPDGKLAKVRIMRGGEAAHVRYLSNALGQRVFKSEIQADQTLPDEAALGTDFVTWLKKQFGWMFTQAAANTSIGTAYLYGDGEIPQWALLGHYDNGSATSKGRSEFIWLPTEDGSAIPVAMYRNGRFFVLHTDHLGTPRLMTNEENKPVWQWPYSAFGDNKPTGVLKATPNPKAAITNQPTLLRATKPQQELNFRFPGQYWDEESNLSYNNQRYYRPFDGSFTQSDPVGLNAGWNRYLYAGANALAAIDPLGLATVRGGTPAQRAHAEQLLAKLKKKIEEASCNCPDKAAKLMELFDKWNIYFSSSPMPTDSDGHTKAETKGRKNLTLLYADSPVDSRLLAHEFAHTFPQNVAKLEAGIAAAFKEHRKRPWEKEAIEFEALMDSEKDICSFFTGQPLGPDPVDEYFRNYDLRPLWKRMLGIK